MTRNAQGDLAAIAALISANVIYAMSYATARVAMEGLPPAFLAFVRLLIAGVILLPLWRAGPAGAPFNRREHATAAAMGAVGFGLAFWLGNLGISLSTTTNAAILVVVEPVSLILLGPALLGESLSAREALGAALAVAGSLLVVLNGLPGRGEPILPHWRGDALLVLTGIAFASYSLWGRPLLARHDAGRVTVLSLFWGAAAIAPLVVREWLAGQRPAWSWPVAAATLYLAVAVTGFGFFLWNWALRRVEASRAAITLNIQPVLGSLLGILWLKERPTAFTIAGGALIVFGLFVAFVPARREFGGAPVAP
jgi:drug/metabolite transporter (DMT)-like permease